MTLTLGDSISRQSPLAQIKFTLRLFRPETSLLCHLARGLSESMEHSRHIVCCFLVPCMSWLTTHLWILSWVLHPIHQKMQGCTHKSQIYTVNAQGLDTADFLAFGSGARFKGAEEVAAESWSYLWNYRLLTSLLEVNLSPFLWRFEFLFQAMAVFQLASVSTIESVPSVVTSLLKPLSQVWTLEADRCLTSIRNPPVSTIQRSYLKIFLLIIWEFCVFDFGHI